MHQLLESWAEAWRLSENTDGNTITSHWIDAERLDLCFLSFYAFLRKKLRHQHVRYELELTVAEHIIHGPFDFALPEATGNRHNVVAEEDWNALLTKGSFYGVDVSNIGQILPLR